jgi:ATP-dependent RNA helicase RhlE
MKFTSFGFHPAVAAGVTAAGYITPTPIQVQAIPPVMAGRDVMGLAQTGTGKTAAFALPILHRLMQGGRGMVRALVIAPTRELAEQINDAVQQLGRQTRLRSITVYGGVGVNPQVEKLRKGVEIVVACPGRLLDHIGQGTIDLSKLEFLVLDEADQMFDMGFLPDIRRILDPVTVQVDIVAPAATVTHALYPVAQHLKTPLLLELLRHTDTESVLIFTRTKHRAKRLGEQLEKADYRAASIQGNLSQNRRQAAMDGFRSGEFQILVATDIAARGIDVSQISHVINYDIPDTTDAYIHRIGRTGRAARSGDAFTLVTDDDGATVRAIERVLEAPIERRTIAGFDYAVPAPRKDVEFARAPRPPRPQPKAKAASDKQPARQGTPAPRSSQTSPVTGAVVRQSAGPGGARRPKGPQRPR